MPPVHDVDVPATSLDRLAPLLGPEQARKLLALGEAARAALDGRTIWNVSSTAAGGGVSEMLHRLVRYVRGAGVDCRWVVIEGTPDFFAATKRVHNRLHGEEGAHGALGDAERDLFDDVAAKSAGALLEKVGADDVVIIHDPQPIALVPHLHEHGVSVIWRCHVGTEVHNEWTDEAWRFLHPWLDDTDASVFSRREYIPEWLDVACTRVIAPAIDPLSAKNQLLDPSTTLAILGAAGIVDHASEGAAFVDGDDTRRPVEIEATVVREGGPLSKDVPLLVQVSRWDRLKDMAGVLRAWVEHEVGETTGAHLLLVGPDVAGVTDDPEGQEVLDECTELWSSLDEGQRATASLVSLPMDDLEENAAVVNALQRHALVVAQKSLREGFGLTVSEAMWKGTPVVGSAVGGIQDQINDGIDGRLIGDPHDLSAFADAVKGLLADRKGARAMGERAHEHVRDNFLADRDLGEWMDLLGHLGIG